MSVGTTCWIASEKNKGLNDALAQFKFCEAVPASSLDLRAAPLALRFACGNPDAIAMASVDLTE